MFGAISHEIVFLDLHKLFRVCLAILVSVVSMGLLKKVKDKTEASVKKVGKEGTKLGKKGLAGTKKVAKKGAVATKKVAKKGVEETKKTAKKAKKKIA